MGKEQPSRFKKEYTLFVIPVTLAFASWLLFPVFVNWVITNLLGYTPPVDLTNPVWRGAINFFYSWYTLVGIAVPGIWIVIAYLSRKKKPAQTKQAFNPLVSFIVPAFNQEKNIYHCINSLFKCTEKFDGICEIIIVDDGSTDCTYEIAKTAVNLNKASHPHVAGKVFRHCNNLGKIEALRTGTSRVLGELVAIVDADSEWEPETLASLVDHKLANGKKAVTGYAHPNGQIAKANLLVNLQRLEYSQGLSVVRCAQSLGNNVLIVPGVIGLYDAKMFREILFNKNIRSVTEDFEITLEMHRKNAKIGYINHARSETVAPTGLAALWHQRNRWFTGWLHNTLGMYRDLFKKRSWISALLWYYIFEYCGTFVDLAAVISFPLLWLYAPDPLLFAYNLLVFIPYGLLIGFVIQAFALRFAYGSCRYSGLLFYTPFYVVLWLINLFARFNSIINFLRGNYGKWHVDRQ
jgi:cellulose synthase/poly-beta-1,6-N-acetylglucosamine synthase-like glycosyltransferase